MFQRLLFVLIVSIPVSVFGMDFYVDSKTGKDEQPGTSIRTAWKSLEKVNEAKLQPGDRVLFRCGSVWNGTLQAKSGTPNRPITYSSYGNGDKPSVRNSVALNKSSFWVAEGENLWTSKPTKISVSRTSRPALGAKLVGYQRKELKGKHENFMQGGVPALRFICTETGSAFYHRQIFLIPLSVTEGKRYLFRFKARCSAPFVLRTAGFSLESDTKPYDPVGTKEEVHCELKPAWNDYSVVFNCDKTETNARVTINLGAAVPNGGVFEIAPTGFAELETDSLGLDEGVVNLVFNGKQAGILKTAKELLREQGDFLFDKEKSQIVLFSKRNPASAYSRIEAVFPSGPAVNLLKQKSVVIDGLDVRYSGGHGIQGDNVDNITIKNCDISWVGGGPTSPNRPDSRGGNGIEFYGNAENIVIESCRIGNVFGNGIGMVGTEQHRKKRIVFRGNTIWNADISIGFYPKTQVDSVIFEDNICHAAGFGWSADQLERSWSAHFQFHGLSNDSKTIVLRGNRLSQARISLVEIGTKFSPELKNILQSDRNTFWQPGSETIVSFEDTKFAANGFVDYQKETGWDTASQIKEEPFVMPSF